MDKLEKLILIITLALSLQACSVADKEYYLKYENYQVPSTHQKHVLSNVFSYQQTTNYTCGPSVVMTLLEHYGKLSTSQMNRDTEMRLANEMHTTAYAGTSITDMVTWLNNNGFSASYGENVTLSMLIDNINRGIPTIIEWNDFSLHSMLVVGYASKGDSPTGDDDVFFTADPASGGSVESNGVTTNGIDSITPNQLTLNQISARAFFNPSHSPAGLYIIAVPK